MTTTAPARHCAYRPQHATQLTTPGGARAAATRVECVYDGGFLMLSPVGDLDLAAVPVFEDAARLIASGPPTLRVTLDLGRVPFLDSSGADILRTLRFVCEQAGTAFHVIGERARHTVVLNLLQAA